MRRGYAALLMAVMTVGATSLDAMALVGESTLCEDTVCVDVWKVTCSGARSINARVRDIDGSGDSRIMVTLLGLSPTVIKGKADSTTSSIGSTSFSFEAALFASSNTTVSAYAIVHVINSGGSASSGYQLDAFCRKTDTTPVNPSSFKMIQQQ